MTRNPHAYVMLVAAAVALLVAVQPLASAQPSRHRLRARAQNTPVRIADPSRSMNHFYQRLRKTANSRPGSIARIAVYGESTNAADRVTSALRRRLQDQYGDAGKGFVPVAPGWEYQRHQDVRWRQEGPWQTWVVNRGNGPGHRYGLGGVVAENRNQRARAWFGTTEGEQTGGSVSRFSLFYQAFPDAGSIELRVDGGTAERVSTQATSPVDRVHHIQVDDGSHELELRPGDDRPNRLYGVVLERDQPGVVVDGLMLVGAFTRVLGHFNARHWARQVAMREVDLLVFWLGGNDATSRSTGFSRQRFEPDYVRSVRRARRGRPDASCLIVSVLDSGDTERGRVRTFARVPRVVAAQEAVAEATGCAFFNLFEATGGYNTMARWRRRGLASGDYKHLTARGAEEVGRYLYEAIVAGYGRFGEGAG